MKDYFETTIVTDLSQEQISNLAHELMPEYSWRMGDSDAQGLYVSGSGEDIGQIKLWLEDDIVDVAISLRTAKLNDPQREKWKAVLLNKITDNFFPSIGKMDKIVVSD